MPLVSLQAAFISMTRKEKYLKVLAYFQAHAPDPETELQYTNPYELLVAVILSAQCTDKRVNMVTPELFRKYPTVQHLATAQAEEIFPLIRSISYPNNKARHLAGMAKMLVDEFNGLVPSSAEELVQLPGVGRKTANVIASVIFNKPAMAVDTHVFRVAARIGLTTKAKTPLAAEKQLVKNIPGELIPMAHQWLILHGRYTCLARNPRCSDCGLVALCNYFSKTKKHTKKTVLH